MLVVAAAMVGLSLTTSGLILDPETSSIDPPLEAKQIAYRVAANEGPSGLLGRGPEEHPTAPEGLHSIKPLDEAPRRSGGGAESQEGAPLEESTTRAVGESREREEAQLGQSLKQWEQRVADYQKRAKASGSDDAKHQAHMLGRQFVTASLVWQRLRQSRGDDWKHERASLETAMKDLQREWDKAEDVIASSSR